MSTDKAILALRLEGPMQSWGFDSQFNRRNTALFPTKSALVGLCCAAMGLSRGSVEEKSALENFLATKLLCIALPRKVKGREVMVKRMQDYHTVGGGYDPSNPKERDFITVSAEDRKPRVKNGQALAVLTYRQYLNDAAFLALFEGTAEFLKQVAFGLKDPIWGIWLGRKACIPSAPVFAGLYSSQNKAIAELLNGLPLESFTRVQEVEGFGSGVDSYMDQVVSFELYDRKFIQRRVMLYEAKAVG